MHQTTTLRYRVKVHVEQPTVPEAWMQDVEMVLPGPSDEWTAARRSDYVAHELHRRLELSLRARFGGGVAYSVLEVKGLALEPALLPYRGVTEAAPLVGGAGPWHHTKG